MFKTIKIKLKKPARASIDTLSLLGPRAMSVIERNQSISVIAAYKQPLGLKLGLFMAARHELAKLMIDYRQQAVARAAQLEELNVATRAWSVQLELRPSDDPDDAGLSKSRAAEAVLNNARIVTEMLLEQQEVPEAARALDEIEPKHASAVAAHYEAEEGRDAIAAQQSSLRGYAQDLHRELVQLRNVTRIVLGSNHVDYQRLRLRRRFSERKRDTKATLVRRTE